MGCVKIFSARSVRGAHGPLMQIWDAHITLETTGARKLKLKTQLDVVKVLASGTIIFPLGGVHVAQGPLM